MEKHLCDYGCGQPALYYFKTSNRWCCSNHTNKCSSLIVKNKGFSGKTHSKETIEKMRRDRSREKHPMFGKHHSEESKNKNRINNLGKIHSEEWIENHKKRMLNGQADLMNKSPRDSEKLKKLYENTKQRMLNGGASYALSFVKNPSKPEIMIRDMVLELYPNADPQHSIFNYSIDIALVEQKIAIEYDGYHHFFEIGKIKKYTKEEYRQKMKEYDDNRQKRIENEGWKFLRYNIFQKFPTKEQIELDIKNLMKNKQ